MEHPLLRSIDLATLDQCYMNANDPLDYRCPYIDPSFIEEYNIRDEMCKDMHIPFSYQIFRFEKLEDRSDILHLASYSVMLPEAVMNENQQQLPREVKDLCLAYIIKGYFFVSYGDAMMYYCAANHISIDHFPTQAAYIHKQLTLTHPPEFPDAIPGKWYYENVIKKTNDSDNQLKWLMGIDLAYWVWLSSRTILT